MNRSFLFLAPGFEEIEALTVVDVMRRAGMDVKTVSIIPDLMVTGAHGVTVKADALFSETEFDNIEWLIVPGGLPGSSNLAEYAPLCT
ncbi:MAG: DJ-1/PfpI family protein, partial [Muribaculaceae bacterium]|nr:DJ-1/PfpI family protein [Muribaculaceae bacterium]